MFIMDLGHGQIRSRFHLRVRRNHLAQRRTLLVQQLLFRTGELLSLSSPTSVASHSFDFRKSTNESDSMTGALYIIARNRVHPLNVSVMAMIKCISKWGEGSSQLVAALDDASQLGDQTK